MSKAGDYLKENHPKREFGRLVEEVMQGYSDQQNKVEMKECECEHTVPVQFAYIDDNGVWTCNECHVEHLSEQNKELKNDVIESESRIQSMRDYLMQIGDYEFNLTDAFEALGLDKDGFKN